MSMSVSPRPMSESPTRQQLEELDVLLKRMLDLPWVKEEAAVEPELPRPLVARGGRPSEVVAFRSARPGRPGEDLTVSQASGAAPAPKATPGYATSETSLSAEDDEPPQVPEFHAPNPDDWIKLAATWQPSPQTWAPLAETWKHSARTLPQAPRVEPVAEETAVPSRPSKLRVPPTPLEMPLSPPVRETEGPPLAPPKASSPASQQEAVPPAWEDIPPRYLWLLVVFNKVFDVGLMLFGPLGEWLKGRMGRNLLGGIGMVCLVLAVACLAADNSGYLGDLQVWLGDWFGWTR